MLVPAALSCTFYLKVIKHTTSTKISGWYAGVLPGWSLRSLYGKNSSSIHFCLSASVRQPMPTTKDPCKCSFVTDSFSDSFRDGNTRCQQTTNTTNYFHPPHAKAPNHGTSFFFLVFIIAFSVSDLNLSLSG